MSPSRREFLGTLPTLTLAGLAAAGLPRPAAAAEPSRPQADRSPLKLGLVTYNLGKDWDVPTLIKHCAATHFEGVELRTTHRHGVEVSLTSAQRAEIKRQFADSPVELMGLGSAFDYHTPDPAKLRADLAATKEYLVLAHDVGASGVKVRPNGLPPEVPVARTLEQIGRSLLELGQFAKDLGQTVRLEVHGAGTSQLPHIRTLMDHARHPNVGVCWNSNPSDLDGAGFDANFDLVQERIVSVHLRDLFLAEYPWRRLLKRLVESGFRGYTMAEIPESADGVRVMHYFRGLWRAYQGLQ
jgi:sugar phosphate isomerase/epimerase